MSGSEPPGRSPAGDRTARPSLLPSLASLFPSPPRLPGDARPGAGGRRCLPGAGKSLRRGREVVRGLLESRQHPRQPRSRGRCYPRPLFSPPHSPPKRAHAAPAVLCLLLSRWEQLILEDFFHSNDSVILFLCAALRHPQRVFFGGEHGVCPGSQGLSFFHACGKAGECGAVLAAGEADVMEKLGGC